MGGGRISDNTHNKSALWRQICATFLDLQKSPKIFLNPVACMKRWGVTSWGGRLPAMFPSLPPHGFHRWQEFTLTFTHLLKARFIISGGKKWPQKAAVSRVLIHRWQVHIFTLLLLSMQELSFKSSKIDEITGKNLLLQKWQIQIQIMKIIWVYSRKIWN